MLRRRALLAISAAAVATAAVARQSPSPTIEPSNQVNLKDPRFGAVGDARTDDTAALQAAVDYCFGPPQAPHGTEEVTQNHSLLIPPGDYKITSPIHMAKLHGGRIIGAGRFVTKITNVSGDSVFVTNGCGYSHFEGMYLASNGKSAPIFDLNWDGSAGGPALQSNTFFDIFFDQGAIGIDIGAGGYMGSENLFLNCFFIRQAQAGLKTSNFNALQNTIVGGNFQTCNTGVWISKGSVSIVESVGFQESKEWDIRVDNSADDTITILGCRTESSNFAKVVNGVHAYLVGCTQIQAGPKGFFLQAANCPTTVERCVSVLGQIGVTDEPRLTVRGSSFGRLDWLSYPNLRPGSSIELEDIQYGGTSNRGDPAHVSKIAKRRITTDGLFEYQVRPST